eukprot:gnl/MRDRNA2_/MRDRNA2_96553_c0_seq1.p1 gnl/MRDRNA2_/MRDRNA2_96553_c0~~gnl/MRDRNA2_/MRDRNA2_96553_c0_seq1.p1  ORF type:complete len:241 (+),score=38.82 gnl/MRDRNA2_/MRDRNA2_96553_c0_seq1:64-786(+)
MVLLVAVVAFHAASVAAAVPSLGGAVHNRLGRITAPLGQRAVVAQPVHRSSWWKASPPVASPLHQRPLGALPSDENEAPSAAEIEAYNAAKEAIDNAENFRNLRRLATVAAVLSLVPSFKATVIDLEPVGQLRTWIVPAAWGLVIWLGVKADEEDKRARRLRPRKRGGLKKFSSIGSGGGGGLGGGEGGGGVTENLISRELMSIVTSVVAGLFVGGGVILAVLRSRRSTSASGKETLLTA